MRKSDKGKLKCDSCGNYHWQWWMISHREKTSQKIGCASDMIHVDGEYQIRCGYGSGYDTSTFKVVNRIGGNTKHPLAIDRLIAQVQHNGKISIVCDKCIERFIRKKLLIDMSY